MPSRVYLKVNRVAPEVVAKVAAAACAKMRKEDEAAEKVRAGAAPWDLTGAAAIYAGMDIQEFDTAFDD